MRVRELEQRIREHFASKGYQDIKPPQGSKGGPDLAFSDGRSTAFVKVASLEDLEDRSSLLEALLQSVGSIGRSNLAYIALPKLYATLIDSKVLQGRGLGLLTYDEREVKEVLPPRFFEPAQVGGSEEVMAELRRLGERLGSLELRVQLMGSRLGKLEALVPGLKAGGAGLKEAPPPAVEAIATVEGLPSFMRDNPWIGVLGRRGKEGVEAS